MQLRADKRAVPGGWRQLPRPRAMARTAAALRRGRVPADALLAALSMLAAYQLSPVYIGTLWKGDTFWAAGVHRASFTLVAYAVGLYAPDLGTHRLALLLRCLTASGFASAIPLAFFYVVFYRPIGRWVIAGASVLSPLLTFLLHDRLHRFQRRRPRRILFLGKRALAERIGVVLASEREPLYEIVGTWPAPPEVSAAAHPEAQDDFVELCCIQDVGELLLTTNAVDFDGLLAPALRCLPLGCHVQRRPIFTGRSSRPFRSSVSRPSGC
jgi:hypothetical protein